MDTIDGQYTSNTNIHNTIQTGRNIRTLEQHTSQPTISVGQRPYTPMDVFNTSEDVNTPHSSTTFHHNTQRR